MSIDLCSNSWWQCLLILNNFFIFLKFSAFYRGQMNLTCLLDKILVGSVLAATLRFSMDDIWVAWMPFGIQNVFDVKLAIYPLMIMRCNLFELIENFVWIWITKCLDLCLIFLSFWWFIELIEWNIFFLWQFK